MRNRAREVFRAWHELIDLSSSGVNIRTINRWKSDNEKYNPTGNSARVIAESVWKIMQNPGKSDKKAALLKAVPELPPDKLANAVEFAAWFSEFAESQSIKRESKERNIKVEILVAAPGTTSKAEFQPIEAKKTLPVHPLQRVHIRITPFRPACIYVLWVRPDGSLEPLFPWTAAGIDHQQNIKRTELRLPPDESWNFEEKRGLETLVVFTRNEPLDKQALSAIAARRGWKPIGIHEPVPGPFVDNLSELATGASSAAVRLNRSNPLPITDPSGLVLKRHMAIAARLSDYLDGGVCVSFGNDGKPV